MSDSSVRRFVILAVMVAFLGCIAWNAINPKYPIPDGLMTVVILTVTTALGLPAGSAVASALKKRDPDKNGNGHGNGNGAPKDGD